MHVCVCVCMRVCMCVSVGVGVVCRAVELGHLFINYGWKVLEVLRRPASPADYQGHLVPA